MFRENATTSDPSTDDENWKQLIDQSPLIEMERIQILKALKAESVKYSQASTLSAKDFHSLGLKFGPAKQLEVYLSQVFGDAQGEWARSKTLFHSNLSQARAQKPAGSCIAISLEINLSLSSFTCGMMPMHSE
eukprot:TRINITY_DN4536_c0_g1_i2.p2 TRINITY_DN4536_c0_g1~~TRINITY_DN4536_c0_g1_i2.p2  ORF type:complete len:133 (-),score=25.72 TRINITY_DN4536_c0_g1_i2:637-1035(-)